MSVFRKKILAGFCPVIAKWGIEIWGSYVLGEVLTPTNFDIGSRPIYGAM